MPDLFGALLCMLLSLALRRASANDDNHFISPPPGGDFNDMTNNPLYHIGDQFDVSWSFDLSEVDIRMWQPAIDGSYKYLTKEYTQSSYPWTVSAGGLNLHGVNSTSQVAMNTFYFELYATGAASGMTCHYFNISVPPSTTSTSTSTTSTSTSILSSATATSAEVASASDGSATTGVSAPTSTSTQNPEPSSGLSSDQKAGIGVGVGVGVSFIAAAVGFFAWWQRRKCMSVYKAVGVANGGFPGAGLSPVAFNSADMATIGGVAGYYKSVQEPESYFSQRSGQNPDAMVHGMTVAQPQPIPELESTRGPVEPV